MQDTPVILVGVAGGIAAYKAAEVVRALVREGCDVRVAMTPSATRFVAPLTFAALTRRRVLTSMFPDGAADGDDLFPHLQPAMRASAFLVCPATADVIARLAAGRADDAVTASALALPEGCRRFFAPAMNEFMWRSRAVRDNVRRLEAAGWRRIGPERGAMACGTAGEGRMAEPAEIVAAVLGPTGDMAGRRWLVLSGPTREPIDAVRFISNASSGRMGRALALEAASRGAAVDVVSGPVDPARLPEHPAIAVISVGTARQMLAAARRRARSADVLVFAAAVADVAPARPSARKLAKAAIGASLPLTPTPDIAAALPRRAGQLRVGFALETGPGARARAAAKLRAKGFDAIVLNGAESPGASGARFEFLERSRRPRWTAWGRLNKEACARRIVDWIAARLANARVTAETKG